jgi:cytochrome c553
LTRPGLLSQVMSPRPGGRVGADSAGRTCGQHQDTPAGATATIAWLAMAMALMIALTAGMAGSAAAQATGRTVPDTLAERARACTACHGKEGRASNHGYLPRIAGKPAGYLYNQLVGFREGRRHYPLMTGLLENLGDDYLREIAGHFAGLDLPYPSPQITGANPALLQRGEALALRGDPARGIVACGRCHGAALTGVQPAVPGLLGLPRDYLNGQLGAWKAGQRRAAHPDCMARVADRLTPDDVAAVSTWLASQPVPRDARAAAAPAQPPPEACGSIPAMKPAQAPVAAGASATSAAATAGTTPSPTPTPTPTPGSPAARGEYLARAGSCSACHTAPDSPPFAGGRAIDTPFGVVYSSNLTPDPVTGIGSWSADDFWRAMHEGRSRDGHLLYPTFPYPNYTRISRADSDAILAYLRSVPGVSRVNRAHTLRFPFGTQWALAAWRTLFFTPGGQHDDPARTPAWNRGAYLVRGLGHCDACHAERNVFGATRRGEALGGGPVPMRRWYAPSLASSREAGVADWPTEEIVRLLKTGQAARATVVGPMAEVVFRSTQYLSDADLQAMAVYLKELPQHTPRASAPARAPEPTPRGATLYRRHCADCHGEQGEGQPGAYPRLAGNRVVTMDSPQNLIAIVLAGGFAPSTAGNPRPFGMPPFGHQLDDDSIAAVLSHVRSAWGNGAAPVSGPQVQQARRN